MFRGRFEHSIDDKGRLAIPSRYRDMLVEEGAAQPVVVTNFDRCLAVYPLAEWERLEAKIANLPQFDPKVIAFSRYFISGAVECSIDRAGRILVPQTLRNHAKLDRDCVISGALTKFEIWSMTLWQKEFDAVAAQFTGMAETMSQFGIQL